jgi:hypothetical protein
MSDEFEFRSGRRNMYFEKFDVELADQPRGGGVVETPCWFAILSSA